MKCCKYCDSCDTDVYTNLDLPDPVIRLCVSHVHCEPNYYDFDTWIQIVFGVIEDVPTK